MIDPNIPLTSLAEATVSKYQERFGRTPRWVVAAPGRVNLIGEHTDYNDGFVLPMAIERYTVIAAGRPASGEEVQWHSQEMSVPARIPLTRPVPKGEPKWSNYCRGVLAGFQARGIEAGPLEVFMTSTVPLGGGLSSSAALEVATATLVEAVTGQKLDPVEKALLCQKAEHDYAGVPCGIMDQFTSTLGQADHLLLLDCRSRQVDWVPMTDPELAVLILNTNVKHELSGGEYAERRRQCEAAARGLGVVSLRDATAEGLLARRGSLDPVVFRRAKHVVSEIERTTHAAEGIRCGNWPTVGQLMYASHYSLRDDYEVSCAELDDLVELAQEIGPAGGVVGCRMTGGGFGGCAVSVVERSKAEAVAARIAAGYEQRTKIKPTLFLSRPAAGAAVVQA